MTTTTPSSSSSHDLCKKDEFKIEFDGGIFKTLERKPLSSKNIREIEKLQRDSSSFKKVFRLYRLLARYCLGITDDDEFEAAIWEDDPYLTKNMDVYGIKSVLDACYLRSINGIAYYSPELEDWILYGSDSKAAKLSLEVIDAWTMFINKQHDIMPNQYHHFYEQGDTILYQEHVADLITIDRMWNEKLKRDRHKEESKQQLKNNNISKKGKIFETAAGSGSGFYGQTFRYDNNNNIVKK